MASQSIRVFDPLHPQQASNREFLVHVQEIVYYGASRIRTTMSAITAAQVHQHQWMQSFLQEELVRVYLTLLYLWQ